MRPDLPLPPLPTLWLNFSIGWAECVVPEWIVGVYLSGLWGCRRVGGWSVVEWGH